MQRYSGAAFLALAVALVASFSTLNISHAQVEGALEENVTKLQTEAAKNMGTIELEHSYSKRFYPNIGSQPLAGQLFQKLFFGVIDYKCAQPIFQRFNMSSVLSVLYFTAKGSEDDVLHSGHYEFKKRKGFSIRITMSDLVNTQFTVFIVISGHMWNQIRNTPYPMPGRDSRLGLIAAVFQNQFGLET
ncbi:hypothetical protein BC939DRAFT_531254 [Gamsiella multidivaricata]|uniref:uncharacterized protein n=1 Tax=Gamsiella multidivaricata TaxID=101098 RepID=UPI0022202054|nr:uncharacterized protein BC939DRAFT_531254 [Gamsiella multidivaricata]KAI7819367.1 hypothetical protein BC939DRAFT_531254 [Gamsiella multidivaricata]